MSLANFSYVLTGATGSFCGANLQVNDIISVQWQIAGSAGYDKCYVAVRPLKDLTSDGAIVAGIVDRSSSSEMLLLIYG